MTEKQVVEYDAGDKELEKMCKLATDSAIQKLSDLYLPLEITDLEDTEQYDVVHAAHMVVREKRIKVDKKREELKAGALKWGKRVQDEANRIFALIEPLESHLKAEKQKVKDEKQRLKDEQDAKISGMIDGYRGLFWGLNGTGTVEQLQAVIDELEAVEVKPEVYFGFVREAEETIAELLTRSRQDLETRIRLDKEEAERKAEAERLAKVKAEQDRIAAEQKAAQDKIDAAQKKVDDEKAILEAEKKAEQERKDREEFERKAKIKAEADAKAAAEQAAKDAEEAKRIAEREAAEAKEREDAERERQEALKPTKEKLYDFADDILKSAIPPRFDDNGIAQGIVTWAKMQLNELSESIKLKADEL